LALCLLSLLSACLLALLFLGRRRLAGFPAAYQDLSQHQRRNHAACCCTQNASRVRPFSRCRGWQSFMHNATHKRCVTVVLQCRRARAEVWKRILRWPRYPPTHLRGCRPSFVCALPFLPAGQRAAVGAKRGLRHTRDACTGGKSAPSGRTHLASRGPAWTGG
jgi:hypothetical protein